MIEELQQAAADDHSDKRLLKEEVDAEDIAESVAKCDRHPGYAKCCKASAKNC